MMSGTQDLKDAASYVAAKENAGQKKRPGEDTVPYRGYFGDTLFEGNDEDLKRFCKDRLDSKRREGAGEVLMPRDPHQASKRALNLVDRIRRLETELDKLKMNSGKYYIESQRKLEDKERTIEAWMKFPIEDDNKMRNAKTEIRRLKASLRQAEQRGYDRALLQKRRHEVDKGFKMNVVRELLTSPVYSQILLCRESKLLGDGSRVTIEQLKHLNHLPADFSEPRLNPYKKGDLTDREEDRSQKPSYEGHEFSEILNEVELWADDIVDAEDT